MPSSYPKTAINRKEIQRRKELGEMRRMVVASENSKVDPSLASVTLSIVKQGDNYLFNYVNILLKDKYATFSIQQEYIHQSQQFLEALKSLWHNINFVLSIQNFDLMDKKGNTIDMEYLRNLKFSYSTNIKSQYAHRSITTPIKSPEKVLSALISTLETSQELIASYDGIIAEIKNASPDLYETLCEKIDLRTKLLHISINLITSLKNDRINLDKFKENIYYGDRTQALITL